MALDSQSNWNVEMSQPLKLAVISTASETAEQSVADMLLPALHSDADEVLLPLEIIENILNYIPRSRKSQPVFWSCALVSRMWYSAAIKILYERPYLDGSNFNEFVRTVCPSKNAHIRQSYLAPLVKRLDMGDLVHNSTKSLTARLLGRFKENIEEFVAPQSSFAINSFASLAKCKKIRHLDFSLISASIENRLLFQTLKSQQDLEVLLFPRSSALDGLVRDATAYSWPPKLKQLHLAGGIDDYFLETHLVNLPASVERLSIQHCGGIYANALLSTLSIVGPQLQHLTIGHPMSRLSAGCLDFIFTLCPSLIAFRVSADYITNEMFRVIPTGHGLRILDLDCSGTAGADVEISANSIAAAIDEGRLPDLRSIRVSNRLAWTATKTLKKNTAELVEIMDDNDDQNPLGIEVGIWLYS